MSYNGLKMSKEAFKNLKDLAVKKGLRTMGEFEQFIEAQYKEKMTLCQEK